MADQSDASDQPVAEAPDPDGAPAEANDSTAAMKAVTSDADTTQPIEAATPQVAAPPVTEPAPTATGVPESGVQATGVPESDGLLAAGAGAQGGAAAVGATAVDGPKLPGWSARAAVTPGIRPRSQPMPWQDEEVVVDPYGGRSWFTPIIIGTVTVLLMGMLVAGVWLIYASSRTKPVPEVSPAAPPSVSPVPSVSTSTPSEYAPTATVPAPPAPTSAAPSAPSASSVSPSPTPSRSPSPSKSLLQLPPVAP